MTSTTGEISNNFSEQSDYTSMMIVNISKVIGKLVKRRGMNQKLPLGEPIRWSLCYLTLDDLMLRSLSNFR